MTDTNPTGARRPVAGRGPARPVLTWVPSNDLSALDLAMDWHELLTGATPKASCVWTTRPLHTPVRHRAADELCWHIVELPRRIDRHLPDADRRVPWSPWGSTSGPNHQFFSMLDAVPSLHDDDWALFIEPDTHPLRDDVAASVRELTDSHPDAWMMGGVPHPRLRSSLAHHLWNHVNGAALYNVSNEEFASFRTRVWIPTLLLRIRSEPRFAFDCATDPAQWDLLPRHLGDAWRREAHRFVRTAGVVNLSTQSFGRAEIDALLDDPQRTDGCLDRAEPWLLHAKGDLAGFRQRHSGATRTMKGV